MEIYKDVVWKLYVKQNQNEALFYEKPPNLAQKLKSLNTSIFGNINPPKRIKGIQVLKKQELQEKIDVLIEKQFYLNKEMTLFLMAKTMDTNTSYLSKVINESQGKSFSNFLNELRINYALKCLNEIPNFKKLTIEHIGDKSGFSSSSTFYKSFKNYTGLTPSYYIKNKLGCLTVK